ncbi:MAG: hypothetical protein ACI9P3_002088 [Bradyrhizobium sp.]|jgi:hypothetical protein
MCQFGSGDCRLDGLCIAGEADLKNRPDRGAIQASIALGFTACCA